MLTRTIKTAGGRGWILRALQPCPKAQAAIQWVRNPQARIDFEEAVKATRRAANDSNPFLIG